VSPQGSYIQAVLHYLNPQLIVDKPTVRGFFRLS